MKFLAFFSIYCLYLLSSIEAKAQLYRCANIQECPDTKGISNSPGVMSAASKFGHDDGRILTWVVPKHNLNPYFIISTSVGSTYSPFKVGAKEFFIRTGLSPPVFFI